jgi:hypothetical protein
MILYNKEWLDNLAIRKASAQWLKSDLISPEECIAVQKKHEAGYKESSIIARIGLFIFTLIILGAAFSLYGLMIFGGSGKMAISLSCIFYGGVCYAAAEYFVRSNNYVGSGIIEALVYTAIGFVGSGIVVLVASSISDIQTIYVYLTFLPLLIFCALRFADAFLTLAAFTCFLIFNALLLFEFKEAGKMILPFETMAISYLAYYIITKQKHKEELRYWSDCITMMEIASLTSLYLAGNYFVIRQLTEDYIGEIVPGSDIGLAPLFYAYTILLPLVYLFLGLKRKSYIFMRLGLVLFVAGILAIKYYHSFMPVETALSMAGIAMILIAYFCIKYLKTPKHGITMEALQHSDKHKVMANIASIAVSEVMASQPQAPAKPDVELGGGNFGGGGAGADF